MTNPNPNVNAGEWLRQLSQVISDRDEFIKKLTAERAAHDGTKAELNGAQAAIGELTRKLAHLESLYGWVITTNSAAREKD